MEIKKLHKNSVSNVIFDTITKYYSCYIKSIKYLGGGSFGMVYKVVLDKSPYVLVAKAYKVSAMAEKESFDITVLGEHSLLPYPKVYFTCKTIDFELLCMEYIEGKNAFNSFSLLLKNKKQKQEFATQIVESMNYTHNYTNSKFGDTRNPIYNNWLDYYKTFAVDIYTQALQLNKENKLDDYIVNTMTNAMDNFDTIFIEKVEKASLIHGDLNLMNIMVKKHMKITAIIDPLDSMYADKEYDLFQLNNLTGKCFNLYNLYKQKFPTSKNCDIKCAFYGLWNEVYCFIKAGTLFKSIMNPLVKNMNTQLNKIQ